MVVKSQRDEGNRIFWMLQRPLAGLKNHHTVMSSLTLTLNLELTHSFVVADKVWYQTVTIFQLELLVQLLSHQSPSPVL